jgi:hypothetical protein
MVLSSPVTAKTTRSQSRDEDYDYDSPRERRERKDNRGREENRRERDDERRRERDYDRRDDRRDDRREDDRRRDRDGEKRDDRRDKERRDERRDDRREERARDRDGERRKERAPAAAPAVQVPARQPSGSCLDIIKQKGYEVISRVTIKNTVIDYVGVSGDRICLCMLDREPGDWLADEERFNDEEPLWFSESSHRISPVRKIDLAKQALLDKLDNAEMNFVVDAFVVVQIGNIINAEDMFEIWDELNVNVTRIDRGTPKEIKLFARTLSEAEKTIPASKLDKVMKLIRSMS